MSELACLVFSKDRPLQLDGFLRSLRAPYSRVYVLAHTRDADYAELEREYYWCQWRYDDRAGFETFVRNFLSIYPRVVFHTDDDLFFDRAELQHYSLPCLETFRLGANTTLQQTTGLAQTPPPSNPWRWRDQAGDFGYPLTLNATVYMSAWLQPLLEFDFRTPTELEAQLASRQHQFGVEWMGSPARSCCVSVPYNRVTDGARNPVSERPEWGVQALREAFRAGWRMHLEQMDFSGVCSAHQVVPLQLFRP